MGFVITHQKGFHIEFANGWCVSVQFGPCNYCDNYDAVIGVDEEKCGEQGSETAEAAIINPDRDLVEHPLFNGDTVGAYLTAEQVLELLNWAARQGDRQPWHRRFAVWMGRRRASAVRLIRRDKHGS